MTASDFSLSPGRLVRDDDRQVGASYASSTFSTAVTTAASPPVVGPTGAAHKGTSPLTALGSGTSTVYGVPGIFGDPDGNGAHGLNERLRVASLYDGRDYLFDLVKVYVGAK